jgi:tellurium resistance protein TerD
VAVSLKKGGSVNLSKEDSKLKVALIGLGWEPNPKKKDDEFDLDVSCLLLRANNKVGKDSDLVFYNNRTSADGSVEHTGDNRTGDGDGDDEQMIVNLKKLPEAVVKIPFIVTIHEAQERSQRFGMVKNAYIRIVNNETNKEIARFDLTEDSSSADSMIFGELYLEGTEWKFKAVAQEFKGGLQKICDDYGIPTE